MTRVKTPVLSALNLAPVRLGQPPRQAIDCMVALAQKTEQLDFARFWIAEHHNMPHLVSSATQVLIAHTLANTARIRVGSGGVMLPNHSPLMVAEQYGTLATLYPDRVDLGLGRAPGTDRITALALRRQRMDTADTFPADIAELQRYFKHDNAQEAVNAYPAPACNIPLYILGSSTDSAHLAARLGLPYAFAAHFAPRMLDMAVEIYRREFVPSAALDAPYLIICTNIAVGENDAHAQFLMSTLYQMFWDMVRGHPSRGMLPPVPDMDALWTPAEKYAAMQMLSASLFGGAARVRQQIIDMQQKYQTDELMVTNYIYDEALQHHSYETLRRITDSLSQ